MKKNVFQIAAFSLVLLLLLPIAAGACAEAIEIELDDSDAGTDVSVTLLDEEWVCSQFAVLSQEDCNGLYKALFVMNAIEYGPYDHFDPAMAQRPGFDSLVMWLDMMSFDYELTEKDGSQCLSFSQNVCLEISLDGDAIARMDLCLNSIKNGFDKPMRITVLLD